MWSHAHTLQTKFLTVTNLAHFSTALPNFQLPTAAMPHTACLLILNALCSGCSHSLYYPHLFSPGKLPQRLQSTDFSLLLPMNSHFAFYRMCSYFSEVNIKWWFKLNASFYHLCVLREIPSDYSMPQFPHL